MIRLKLLLMCLTVMLTNLATGQQLPQYSQFLLNKAVYNPAAMAINPQTEVTLIGRWQMLGFGLEPRTVALFGQSKIQKKEKVIFNPASRIGQEIVPFSKKKEIKTNAFCRWAGHF